MALDSRRKKLWRQGKNASTGYYCPYQSFQTFKSQRLGERGISMFREFPKRQNEGNFRLFYVYVALKHPRRLPQPSPCCDNGEGYLCLIKPLYPWPFVDA